MASRNKWVEAMTALEEAPGWLFLFLLMVSFSVCFAADLVFDLEMDLMGIVACAFLAAVFVWLLIWPIKSEVSPDDLLTIDDSNHSEQPNAIPGRRRVAASVGCVLFAILTCYAVSRYSISPDNVGRFLNEAKKFAIWFLAVSPWISYMVQRLRKRHGAQKNRRRSRRSRV